MQFSLLASHISNQTLRVNFNGVEEATARKNSECMHLHSIHPKKTSLCRRFPERFVLGAKPEILVYPPHAPHVHRSSPLEEANSQLIKLHLQIPLYTCRRYFPLLASVMNNVSTQEALHLVDMTAQDGCQPLHRINLSGKVVLLRDRGGCSLEVVAENFHKAKVYAVVIGLSSNKLVSCSLWDFSFGGTLLSTRGSNA